MYIYYTLDQSISNQQGFGSMVGNLTDFYFMRSPSIEGNITKLLINQITPLQGY